ncbi:hypothetical protein [Absicoccus intestinalis]|uniref:Ankyrin repeat domain-containing protein n=1 Tax=Absicoccus intestinalis TaxID=2926319 RepID=A0ABU4WSG2_9FIRM|nr:hypothetical protein [Absicoccus sp. CLA-KB-P134]MDX8418392.1 hypothetical protein [Absicoccus sp. CLA-KB-P134]
MSEKQLALHLLNAVWNENENEVLFCIKHGADPSWVFNGFPILIHAICTQNQKIIEVLIDAGAKQTQEAFGFALEHGYGSVIQPLAYRGIIPKHYQPQRGFGEFPQRFAY